jgi:hypothetical protein
VRNGIEPFEIDVPDPVLRDLDQRLATTRLAPQFEGEGWALGVDADWLRELVRWWREDYDWRVAEARINQFPHVRTVIDGQVIHAIHRLAAARTPSHWS